MTGGSSTIRESAPLSLPTVRRGLFDPPSELERLREEEPIRRLAYPDGHIGWLVTSYSLVRAVMADSRFSLRDVDRLPVDHPGTRAAWQHLEAENDPAFAALQAGNILAMDPPEHTRFRRLLVEHFTVSGVSRFRSQIDQIVNDHLDAMQQIGPPVDLVESFAVPIPLLTICELLGVPYSDKQTLRHFVDAMGALDSTSAENWIASFQDFGDLIRRLVQHKRAQPTEDLLSRLSASGELSEDELVGVGMVLTTAGFHTTAAMIAMGTFALLHEQRRWEALKADSSLLENAVEELLRYLTVAQLGGHTRTALEDVELGGVLIKAGERVHASLPAANRDPERFDHPEMLHLSRDARGHFAFGYGPRNCIGQHLARIEMHIAFSALLRRFPTLSLAVPAEEVRMHPGNVLLPGPYELPVAW